MTLVPDSTLEQFRTAMRFSLWTWGAYWAGGGLLLVAGGMQDPIGIAVALLLAAEFLAVIATGALDTPRGLGKSRAVDFVVKRPIYLFVAFVVVMAFSSFIPSLVNGGLFLFAGAYFGAIVLSIVRLVQHVTATGQGVFAARADQAYLMLGLAAFVALQVFLDQLLPGGVGWPAPAVAAFNWVQFVYPAFLLLAVAPFRQKLRLPMTIAVRKPEPVPAE